MKLLLVFKRIIFSEWYTEQVETQHSGQSDHGTHCLQKVFVFLLLFSNSYNMDHIMQIGAGSVNCAHIRSPRKKFDHPCIRPVQRITWAPGLLFAFLLPPMLQCIMLSVKRQYFFRTLFVAHYIQCSHFLANHVHLTDVVKSFRKIYYVVSIQDSLTPSPLFLSCTDLPNL